MPGHKKSVPTSVGTRKAGGLPLVGKEGVGGVKCTPLLFAKTLVDGLDADKVWC
ncbi:hypothetical protein HYR99_28480 [Candidatus Poribacteria bacterium]|nr:hypothetical protein [Candidatus Poribacteria bacterium]